MRKDISIEIEDVLGSRTVNLEDLTVGQILASQRLPETLFQPYLVTDEDEAAAPVPLATRLSELPEGSEKLLVRAIRNTLFPTVLPADDSGGLDGFRSGVGFRQVRSDSDDQAIEVHSVLDRHAARKLVIDQVSDFAGQRNVTERGCIFGVSGGGDSNALAWGLSSALPPERLSAFTLVFDAVFSEAAASRASVLCQELGIKHQVLRESEIADILGISTSLDDLYADFKAVFTHEALHFFGTFLILRCARKLADESGFGDLAFGYNREDLLAEALFMLMNGRRPLSIPVRPIGRHRIVMPVWQVPKLLLDACHPAFSLENYRERDPFTTRQRSLGFFLAHSMDSAYPQFGLSVLTGISQAFEGSWGELEYNDELDVFVTEQADDESIERVRSVLTKHFQAETV